MTTLVFNTGCSILQVWLGKILADTSAFGTTDGKNTYIDLRCRSILGVNFFHTNRFIIAMVINLTIGLKTLRYFCLPNMPLTTGKKVIKIAGFER